MFISEVVKMPTVHFIEYVKPCYFIPFVLTKYQYNVPDIRQNSCRNYFSLNVVEYFLFFNNISINKLNYCKMCTLSVHAQLSKLVH